MENERELSLERDDSRLRILYLLRMLRQHTDESHSLSTNQIIAKMKSDYGISMHRTTLTRDIEVLRTAGIEVLTERRRALHYSLPDRPLSLPELRILIDAVLSSKFITEKKSGELVEKLISLTSETDAEKLRRTVHVTGRAKSENEKGYYIVDAVNSAIHSGRKISFRYFTYDGRKNRVLKNDGDPYTVSPYDLIWDGDYYYLTGYCDERGEVRVFRVDRIERRLEVLDEPAVKPPRGYRVEKYTNEVFRMFATQETTEVRLLCENDMMKAVIDRFGAKVRTKVVDKDHFRATVKVCASPTFFRWVFGWNGKVMIEGPETVRAQYAEILRAEAERYT